MVFSTEFKNPKCEEVIWEQMISEVEVVLVLDEKYQTYIIFYREVIVTSCRW